MLQFTKPFEVGSDLSNEEIENKAKSVVGNTS